MLRRRTRAALAAVPLACALAPAALGAAAPAGAATAPGQVTTICAEHHYRVVTGAAGRRYVVENGNFGGRPECITNFGLRPNFTVTRSGADSTGPQVDAYPFALYGCSWKLCTPGSDLPAPVRQVRWAAASWSIRPSAPGRWNAAFDVWFGRHRSAINGQAKGAELMIWLDARDYPPVPSRVIRVDNRRWYIYHWVTSHDGAHWNYVQIRAVRPVTAVRELSLMPIIRRVEKMGLIRPKWWMLNIESGFEIWHGGRGLQTTWFAASVRRR
jgi:Glycosyl hydrolase family 12